MFQRFLRKRKEKRADAVARRIAIDPDVVFLDATNLPDFDKNQFEGKIERPIGVSSLIVIAVMSVIVFGAFGAKLWSLQVVHGTENRERSEQNRLKHSTVFSERGIISDRNGVPLVWNVASSSDEFALRRYSDLPGISHLTGYVTYPAKDSSGNYYSEEYVPKAGIEKFYDSELRGTHGVKLVETDVKGNVVMESVLEPSVPGKELKLSVDSRLQSALYNLIDQTARTNGFTGGAGLLMDITTGELLTHVTYPEYSAETMTNGTSAEIRQSLAAPFNPFLDRISDGLYTPGSIVKPFMALAALSENIISPEKQILSTGSLTVPNPYDPSKPSVFKDWKAHGWVDMRHAIAVSSDVYFYEVGGGFGDQKGLGITKIDKYMNMFGMGRDMNAPFFASMKGLVPTPAWKEARGDGPWRLGDTYITAIGQYGFQVTPIQMVRALSAIATGGTLIEPTIVAGDTSNKQYWQKIDLPAADFQIVREGMRLSAKEGTAAAFANAPVEVAGKTGTAELGVKKDRVNSWVMGFYPYDAPKYVFVVLMENGPVHYTYGGPSVGSQFLNEIAKIAPEYLH